MIKLTSHAEDMIAERGIALEWVVITLESPDSRSIDPRDTSLTRSYCKISPADGRILRVVHRPDGADILVITAFFDRGMKL
jgi:hypothetical protein